jgi:ABC-2 type transport system permease protein
MKRFSLQRTWAVFVKELQQMLRDRLTFAMAIGVPVLQLVLFGYAINTDPKGLPTALIAADTGPMARSVSAALQNTGYFRIVHAGSSEAAGEALLESGEAQFMVAIPADFSRRVIRGERRCWWRSTRPTRRPRATRSPRWRRSPTRHSRTT